MTQKIDGHNLREIGRTAPLAVSTRDKEMIYEPGQSCDMAINEIIEISGEAIYHENREGQSA